MATKMIIFITLLAYSIIVSQSFMYILSLQHVQLNLEADSYTEFRKLVDFSMRANFKYVIYVTLIFNILLVIFTIKSPGSLVFIAAAISLIALVIDIMLTLKGNLPINDIINSWSTNTIPSDWQNLRTKWFAIFQYRQMANISGFVLLLFAAIFRKVQ